MIAAVCKVLIADALIILVGWIVRVRLMGFAALIIRLAIACSKLCEIKRR